MKDKALENMWFSAAVEFINKEYKKTGLFKNYELSISMISEGAVRVKLCVNSCFYTVQDLFSFLDFPNWILAGRPLRAHAPRSWRTRLRKMDNEILGLLRNQNYKIDKISWPE